MPRPKSLQNRLVVRLDEREARVYNADLKNHPIIDPRAPVGHETVDRLHHAAKLTKKFRKIRFHPRVFIAQSLLCRLTGRQIGRDHVPTIAETGGSIGIWRFFPSLD
jgi:hypothetical protein